MKSYILSILICLVGVPVFAQNNNEPPRKETKKRDALIRPNICPSIYITTSTGINNNTGVAGLSFDVPIEKYLSAELGAGRSTWGYKLYLGGKYYTKPCHRGWAIGTGITYNTGIDGFQQNMTTIYNTTETVTFNLHSESNVLIAAYYYWNLGKRYNRFYLEFGYSVPLSNQSKYDQISGDPVNNTSANAIKLLAPGGLIAAVGFSFAIH